ncbi:flagellar biosynthesis protein FlgL [Novosphingobium mathurense]|uniref:Flagellar hook-associated protein 3 FlgL n=1 Tax=Novosphingobium mathurense TaxID=428990 RepID=A0A1U6HHY5_9SPHN|nr:flagellar biosynthesis protein FlgL [Novosphingobium mathurense]SLJ95394.1 flagellar hook-associated protein 3 FlgL [Novosphingobium mathurense]
MAIVSTSTSAFFERSRSNLQDLRAQTETLQAQLSSGKKLARSSDDPVAASRLRSLSRLESLSNIDKSNSQRVNADLTLADAAIKDMSTALVRAQELATQAASGTSNDAQRAAIGRELDSIYSTLMNLANARDSNGHALFGGESAGDAYSVDGAGNPVYVGTASSGSLSLGEGQTVSRSLTGPEFLSFTVNGTPTDLLSVVKDLGAALQGAAADPAGAARDGLDALKAGLDAMTTGQTVVGTRMAWIELTSDRRTNLSQLRSTEETEIGSTDIASTAASLQEALLVLEASQASFTKLANLSLFNKLG